MSDRTRSKVVEKIHFLPLRIKTQIEADGRYVVQLPGYLLRSITVSGKDEMEALERLEEMVYSIMEAQK